ncbi:MAG TPA: nuclease-related domain-containing protein [Opitutaceae bacterium]|nr:nuclease-related domain-containing protein [Opitutaceae bacterium]
MGFFQSILAAIFDSSKENRNYLRGASGEAQGNLGLFLFLPAEYVVLSNVTLPTPGGTTQIDHVVVSQYGVHVIESKNIKGSIYGAPDQERWTGLASKKRTPIQAALMSFSFC